MHNSIEVNGITVITGPMRSGTSCLTGLLESFGFDLGKNIRILRNKTEHNPMGHFEADLLFTINTRLIEEVPGGDWGLLNVPAESEIEELAGRRDQYFNLFIRKFDGVLCKDPILCLTLPLWEKHWPGLQNAIFCLRNPLSVARSMHKRYEISFDHGLLLWKTYTSRFFDSKKKSNVYVFDFDEFSRSPVDSMDSVLSWLGKPFDRATIEETINAFFSSEFIHWSFDDAELRNVPDEIAELYNRIRSLATTDRANPGDRSMKP